MTIDSGAALLLEPVLREIPYLPLDFNDQNYEEEEFDSLNQARSWQDRLALLACLRMAIDHFTGNRIPLHQLLQRALGRAAYIPEVGWSLDKIATTVEEYGVRAARHNSYRHLNTIATRLIDEALVITIVGGGRTSSVGSRALLLYGVTEQSFVFHDPLHPEGKGREYTRRELLSTLSPTGSALVIEKA